LEKDDTSVRCIISYISDIAFIESLCKLEVKMQARRKGMEMIPSTNDTQYANSLLGKLRGMKAKGLVKIEIDTNKELRDALLAFVEKYASGQPLRIVEENSEYTPNEAAEILRVSRPFFNKLLDQGEIPYRMVGSHRRITANDLFRYKEEDEKKSKEAFKKHAKTGQRLEHG
jgi:excisionase family DNA binding protein